MIALNSYAITSSRICDRSILYLYLDLIYHAFLLTFALFYDQIAWYYVNHALGHCRCEKAWIGAKMPCKVSFIDKRHWPKKGECQIKTEGRRWQKLGPWDRNPAHSAPDQRRGANPSAEDKNPAHSAPVQRPCANRATFVDFYDLDMMNS